MQHNWINFIFNSINKFWFPNKREKRDDFTIIKLNPVHILRNPLGQSGILLSWLWTATTYKSNLKHKHDSNIYTVHVIDLLPKREFEIFTLFFYLLATTFKNILYKMECLYNQIF